MRMAEVAATSIVNTFEPSRYFWTCGQDNPVKSTQPPAQSPETCSPGSPHLHVASCGCRGRSEAPYPTGGRGRPAVAPLPGMGAPRGRASRLHSAQKRVRPLRPAWPHSSLHDDPSPGQDTGAIGTPVARRGPVVPQAVRHCFRKQNPESGTPSRRQGGVSGQGHQAAGLRSVSRQVTNHRQQSHSPAGDTRRP